MPKLEVRMRQDVWDRLNVAVSGRGVSRSEFVRTALEAALGDGAVPEEAVADAGSSAGSQGTPASPRASEERVDRLVAWSTDPSGIDREALGNVDSDGWGIERVEELASMPGTSTTPSVAELRQLVEKTYGCPVPGCSFRAKSPAARCGVHGRLVVGS